MDTDGTGAMPKVHDLSFDLRIVLTLNLLAGWQ